MVIWPGWCSFARRGRACVRGRAVRTHALVATLVMFFVLFTSVDAYAAPKRDASSNGDGTTNYAVSSLPTNDGGDVVKSKWSAACWSLGKDPYGSGMTAEIRAKLSNEGTGGRFYEFANYFVGSEPTQTAVGMPGFMQFVQLWGMSYWYAANVPDELFRGAATDLVRVMNGEDLGGGSGGDVGEYLEFTGTTHYSAGSSYRYFEVDGARLYYRQTKAHMEDSSYLKCANDLTLRVPTAGIANFLAARPSTQYDYFCLFGASGGVSVTIYAVPAGKIDFEFTDNTVYGSGRYCSRVNIIGGNETQCYQLSFNAGVGRFTYDDGLVTMPYVSESSSGAAVAAPAFLTSYDMYLSAGIHQVPTIPPTNWPDDEPITTPDPPEVPGPDEPVGGPVAWPDVPGDPVVTVDPPVDPPSEPWTGILEPTNTTAQDYTPWLRAILAALNAINQNLATHCVHLQNALNDAAEWLNTEFAKTFNAQRLSLQSYEKLLFSTLANRIDAALYDLELYLQDLFEWLASQMSFSVSGGGFDDSTVVSWLKRIYERLGVQRWKFPGDKPTETELEDDFDWWAWLIDTLVGLLGNGLADGVDTLVGILEELTRLFPFSIPWDAAAIFGVIVAEPVTPQWDFVIPAVAGWWPEFTIHVDLSALNGAAAASRTMFLLLWAMCLIKRTDWLVGIFEQSARIVTQFLEEM